MFLVATDYFKVLLKRFGIVRRSIMPLFVAKPLNLMLDLSKCPLDDALSSKLCFRLSCLRLKFEWTEAPRLLSFVAIRVNLSIKLESLCSRAPTPIPHKTTLFRTAFLAEAITLAKLERLTRKDNFTSYFFFVFNSTNL